MIYSTLLIRNDTSARPLLLPFRRRVSEPWLQRPRDGQEWQAILRRRLAQEVRHRPARLRPQVKETGTSGREMNLDGLKVAMLVDDGFEQVELVEPRNALDEAGAETRIVSPKGERVRGWNFTDWGDEFPVDVALDRTHPGRFRRAAAAGRRVEPRRAPDSAESRRVREVLLRRRQAGGGDLPRPLDGHRGRRGARAADRLVAVAQDRPPQRRREWVDQEVVVDGNLVSSRKPDDIPAFNRAMIELFSGARRPTGHTV